MRTTTPADRGTVRPLIAVMWREAGLLFVASRLDAGLVLPLTESSQTIHYVSRARAFDDPKSMIHTTNVMNNRMVPTLDQAPIWV